ncbi:MAG: lipoprotein releasing system, transrane protein, LolC/E family [Magnetococcales bacterium]|nr:lipoprotein releasing system, transrane protein, LolC/E family [Magnetococcales bacterium]HIJ85761.1 lipoprotein-releasing ABC transporter permease subunit [Magnetococcales bacterium]
MVFHHYEWFIGLRYLRAKRSQHFISVITFLSMGGIALGVAALIVVLAVMTGFRAELQKQILGVTGQLNVRSNAGSVAQYPRLLAKIDKHPQVTGAAPFITGQAMVQGARGSLGTALRGIDPFLEKNVSALNANLVYGSLDDLRSFGIILGRKLAFNLGVEPGDHVAVITSAGNVTAMGTMPRMKRFKVVGIFDSGMYEYDSALAYIHQSDAQALYRMEPDEVSGIDVMTPSPDLALKVGKELAALLGSSYSVQDWMQMNRSFFRALQVEKATMFIILFLVVVVAAFNIISSLIMVVMEKGKEIAILKTMGATSNSIIAIFLINGGVVGITGTLSGLGLGLLLAFNLEAFLGQIEKLFSIQILHGEVYFIDHLPSVVLWTDVGWIVGISLLLSLSAAIYPAWRAAGVDPVESLRYE